MATSTIKGNQDTGWLTLKSGIIYKKINGIVFVNIEGLATSVTSGTDILGTLPSGFRPDVGINIQPYIRKNTTPVAAWITASGEINVIAISQGGTYAGTISFPAGN